MLATGTTGNGYKLISIRCSLAANNINFAMRGSVRRQVRSLAVRIQSGDMTHCGMKKRIVPLATTSQHNPPESRRCSIRSMASATTSPSTSNPSALSNACSSV